MSDVTNVARTLLCPAGTMTGAHPGRPGGLRALRYLDDQV